MMIFDGKYGWTGKKTSPVHPVNWWAGAYWLKIIDLSCRYKDVRMLKPIAVIVSDTGEGASATNYASDLVKSVCRDFNLNIDKIIWIEYHSGPPPSMEVAKFKPVTSINNEVFYQTAWREIRLDELKMIQAWSSEARLILKNLEPSQ
jgi:hypothetical protein